MRFYVLLISLLFFPFFISAQISKSEFTKDFALQTKSIDDFFERFDFKESTNFRKYLAKEYPAIPYTRKNFIPILFNQKSTTITEESKDNFVANVTDSLSPQFLSYSDTNWYAELSCKVIYLGKPRNLTLILKVEGAGNNMYSWTIVSAKADFLKFRTIKSDSLILSNKDTCCAMVSTKSTRFFLTPISHGIDFTNVDNIFMNNAHINDYIYKGARSFELCKLISMVKRSKIKFLQIDKIAYHLLQLNGYILKVDYFSRNDYNSGWLISQLLKVNEKEKENYKLKNLNIATN